MHSCSRVQLAATVLIPLGLVFQLVAPAVRHAIAAQPATPIAANAQDGRLFRSAQAVLANAERGIPVGGTMAAVQRFLDDPRWWMPAYATAAGRASIGALASDSPTAAPSTTATLVPAGTRASTTTATPTPGASSTTASPTAGSASATISPTAGSATPIPSSPTVFSSPTIFATTTITPTVPSATATPVATRTPVPLIPNTAPFTGKVIQTVARAALPDVVLIGVHGPSGMHTGTGFVIRSDTSGVYALTTRGILGTASAGQVTVTSPLDGRSYPALAVRIGRASPGGASDLGIVRFAAKGLSALPWADSDKAIPGQPVLSLAYTPGEGGPPALYEGIVSAVHRDLGDGAGPIWIQHQTPLDARASGAPLLDLTGAVLGMSVKGKYVQAAAGRGQLLGVFYAAPASSIRIVADALIAASRGATVPKAPGTAYVGSGYTLTLPNGWTTKKTSAGLPLLSSGDGQVAVSVAEHDLAVTPSDDELKKQIADDAAVLGKTLKITFSIGYRPISIGTLHGLTGVLSVPDHSVSVLISYLSDGQHLLQILELYSSGTPQSDLDQASALIGSIVATGGGTATSGSPVPTPTPSAGSAYNGKGFSVRLPGGWSGQKLSDGTPVIVSDDGAVVVRISEVTLQAALSDDQIRAVIAKVAEDFGKQDGVTYAVSYGPLQAGALHGVAGTLTAPGKPTIIVSVLAEGPQTINAVAVFDPAASQADHSGYAALIGSITLGSTTPGTTPGDGGLN